MTTRSQERFVPRWPRPFLAALIAALAAILLTTMSPVSVAAGAETRVRASAELAAALVGPEQHVSAGQHRVAVDSSTRIGLTTGVTANNVPRTTGYGYDLTGNTTSTTASRTPRAETTPGGSSESIGAQTRVTTYTYDPRGLVATWRKPGDTTGAPAGNRTTFGYYDNGLLRSSTERRPNGDLVASHAIT